MSQFVTYSDIIFDAFCLHTKRKEIVDRKQDIIDKIFEYYNAGANSILFVGFNPAILSTKIKNIYVDQLSPKVISWIKNQGINITELSHSDQKTFDCVVAFDEYLTFSNSDVEQQSMIDTLCGFCSGTIITTVKDYKNQDFKDREYSQPAIIKANSQLTAFTEIHDWDQKDKNAWQTAVYKLSGLDSSCQGIYTRRALFFKQLAKFSMDAGATNFLVHKNLMYKSLIKKNYEHVISINFEA